MTEWLEPLPITFFEEQHKYRWDPTGEFMATSVTAVCSHDKAADELANIEKYRWSWEPRGLAVHAAAESMLNGETVRCPDEYAEWIEPLLEHKLWREFDPIATELRLVDLKKSIGGSLDALGYWRGKLTLIDFKSQSNPKSSTYSTDRQMGAYAHMLGANYGLIVDECRTVWCRPGKCTVGARQDPDSCCVQWVDAWDAYVTKTKATGGFF